MELEDVGIDGFTRVDYDSLNSLEGRFFMIFLWLLVSNRSSYINVFQFVGVSRCQDKSSLWRMV